MNTALGFPFGFFTNDNTPQDSKYFRNFNQSGLKTPYFDSNDVNTQIVSGIRHIGLTVNVAGTEWWYKNGITNSDLVPKTPDLSSYELLANKVTNFTVVNNTKYPTTQAVSNYITSVLTGVNGYIPLAGSDQITGNLLNNTSSFIIGALGANLTFNDDGNGSAETTFSYTLNNSVAELEIGSDSYIGALTLNNGTSNSNLVQLTPNTILLGSGTTSLILNQNSLSYNDGAVTGNRGFNWSTGDVHTSLTSSSGTTGKNTAAGLKFPEANISGNDKITLKAANSVTSAYTIELPGTAPVTNTYWKFDGTNYVWASVAASGSTTFIGLTDVPGSYTSQALKLLRVNSGATGLEFFTPTYLTSNQTITLTGDITGSGTTSIATSYNNIVPSTKGGAGTINGLLKANGSGIVSAATLGTDYINLSSLSASTPLSYNNTTGVFSISAATTSVSGYLTSTDWNTFNNKQSSLTFSNGLTNTSGSVKLGGSITQFTSLTGNFVMEYVKTGGGRTFSFNNGSNIFTDINLIAANTVAIGLSAGISSSSSNSVFIGSDAGNTGSGNNGVVIGYQTGNTGIVDQSVLIGTQAGASISAIAGRSVMIGYQAGTSASSAAQDVIFIGYRAGYLDLVNNSGSLTSILIGKNTSTGGYSRSIAIGENATNTATNQFLIASTFTQFNMRGVNYIMPSAQGASSTVLTNDGSGNLSWTTVSSGGSGSVTSVSSSDSSILVTNPTTTVNLSVTKAPKWSTARNLAGNSVDGSGDVIFNNKFIAQGTTDSGLSGTQFLGALGTGLLKNTTTTGVLSIAAPGTDYVTGSSTNTFTNKSGNISQWTNDSNYLSGSGVANRVAYYSGTNSLTNSSNLTFDGTKLAISNQSLIESSFLGGAVTGLKLQTNTSNARSFLGVVPNGTSVLADIWAFSTNDFTTNVSALAWGFEAGSNAWGFNVVTSGSGVMRDIYLNATGSATAATSNLICKTNGRVGIGNSTPFDKFSNTSSNIVDSGGAGVSGAGSMLWTTNSAGYTVAFYNNSTSAASNILLIKGAGTTSNIKLFTVNTGSSQTTNGTDLFNVLADGSVKVNNLSTAGIVTNTSGGILGTTSIIATSQGGTGLNTIGSAGQSLRVNTGGTGLEYYTPSSGFTNPMTTTGDMIYSSSGSTPARLAIATTGKYLTSNGIIPVWSTNTFTSDVQTIGDGRYISLASTEKPSRSTLYFSQDITIGRENSSTTQYQSASFGNSIASYVFSPSNNNRFAYLTLSGNDSGIATAQLGVVGPNIGPFIQFNSESNIIISGADVRYSADYSGTYTDRSLIDRGYTLNTFTQRAGFNRYLASGNGTSTMITIPHGLTGVTTTSPVLVVVHSDNAVGYTKVTRDATNVYIYYSVAPISGTNNLEYSIFIKV